MTNKIFKKMYYMIKNNVVVLYTEEWLLPRGKQTFSNNKKYKPSGP